MAVMGMVSINPNGTLQSFHDQNSRETPELSDNGGLKQPLYITHNMSSSKIRTEINLPIMPTSPK